MIEPIYQVGGSVSSHSSIYVTRQADQDLYDALLAGEFCYVFNARQMGKSSLRSQIQRRLADLGYRYIYLDMTQLGSEEVTHQQWYRGVMLEMLRVLGLLGKINIKDHWQRWETLPPVQQLQLLIDEILRHVPSTRLFILVDEIDSLLSLDFPVNDFFAFIRACHEDRQNQADATQVTWALFGVATPSDLIQDRKRTPFNVGRAIDLQDFRPEEAYPLMAGFKQQVSHPEAVLKAILDWTGGQPFLTQKLCQLATQKSREAQEANLSLPPGTEAAWIDDLVQTHIIQHWESQDHPEHLRTIRNRLLMEDQQIPRLLGIYQQILDLGGVALDSSPEQTALLLSGLVCKRDSQLQVKNRIYRTIFDGDWIQQQLAQRRPYSTMLQRWLASGKAEASWLLRGQALQEAQAWSQDKSLGDVDYQFLQASQLAHQLEIQQKLEAARLKESNARLLQEQKAARLRSALFGVVSLGFVGTLGLSLFAGWQFYEAKRSEVRALASSSQGQFASHQQLDAMVAAIKAKQILNRFRFRDEATQRQVSQALNQVVFGSNEVNRLTGHEGAGLGIDISPDGQFWATASNDKTAKIWSRDGQRQVSLAHGSTVLRVAFSPDSQRVVTGSLDGRVRLWNLDGTLEQNIAAHDGPVWGIAFSPDGRLIASGSGDQTVKLWQPDGTPVATLPVNQAAWGVAFSPDGSRVAAAVLDGTIQLWAKSGEPLQEIQGHQGLVWDIAFCPIPDPLSPNLSTNLSANLSANPSVTNPPSPTSPNYRLVSVGADRTTKVWSSTGELIQTLPTTDAPMRGVDCSDNGKYIAVAGQDNQIHIWTVEGQFIRTLQGHQAAVRDIAFSPDALELGSVSEDGSIKIWRRNTDFLRLLQDPIDSVWGIAVSPDSQSVVAASGFANQLIRWENFEQRLDLRDTPQANLFSVAFFPNQPIMAGVGGSTLRLLRWEDGAVPQWSQLWERSIPTTGTVMSVAVSPDGQIIASGSDDGKIRLWTPQGDPITTLNTGNDRIWQMDFQPLPQGATSDPAVGTGKHLFVLAAANGAVEIWNTDGTKVHTLKPPGTTASWGAAFSPDGTLVTAASFDGTLWLWQVDGTPVFEIMANRRGLTRVAFSPDGQTIATGGLDATIKLWNLDGTLQNTLLGHQGFITSLAYSPDGRFLYSGGTDSEFIAWDLDNIATLDPLEYACGWVQDYLQTDTDRGEEDRNLCQRFQR